MDARLSLGVYKFSSCDGCQLALLNFGEGEKLTTVLAVPLPGFQGLLEAQTQPRTSFLKEISDRVRVIACLDALRTTAGNDTPPISAAISLPSMASIS